MKLIVLAALIFAFGLVAVFKKLNGRATANAVEQVQPSEEKRDRLIKSLKRIVSGTKRLVTDDELIFDGPRDLWLWMLGVLTFYGVDQKELD